MGVFWYATGEEWDGVAGTSAASVSGRVGRAMRRLPEGEGRSSRRFGLGCSDENDES